MRMRALDGMDFAIGACFFSQSATSSGMIRLEKISETARSTILLPY